MTRYRKELNDILTKYLTEIIKLKKQFELYSASAELKTMYHPNIQENWIKETNTAKEKVDAAFNNYMQRLDSKYTVRGDEINEHDIQLLNPMIFSLTQREFDKLQKKYADNTTMLAALRSYADTKDLLYNSPVPYEKKAELAKAVRNSAIQDIDRNNLYELADWCVTMQGELYREADQLEE